jgi:ADP-L-glycero-D-manno-heptose 6-epimerase
MIVITGAAGFIGSCLISKLNNKGIKDIILVDDFSREDKNRNILNKVFVTTVERSIFFEWFRQNNGHIEFVFHIGARTDTAEFNMSVFDELNTGYSKTVWDLCTRYNIPLIYASSAATYGDGSLGYDDDPKLIPSLRPLNPYGVSKNEFDNWVLQQEKHPPCWFGLKFFNVFGPNEYHKGRMASVAFHAFHQVTTTGRAKLFRSHDPDYGDGLQLRDFIYVKDIVDVLWFLMNHQGHSGIYNLGSGKARTFVDLVKGVFSALNKEPQIDFIDIPADIRDKYQYFTEANMGRLRAIGYNKAFTPLETAVEEYVQGYLSPQTWF